MNEVTQTFYRNYVIPILNNINTKLDSTNTYLNSIDIRIHSIFIVLLFVLFSMYMFNIIKKRWWTS